MRIVNYVLENKDKFKDVLDTLCKISEEYIIEDTCPSEFGFKNKFDCDSARAIGIDCEECWKQNKINS